MLKPLSKKVVTYEILVVTQKFKEICRSDNARKNWDQDWREIYVPVAEGTVVGCTYGVYETNSAQGDIPQTPVKLGCLAGAASTLAVLALRKAAA